MVNLKLFQKQAQKDIAKAKNLKELDEVYRKYLGKKGKLTQVLRSLKNLPEKEKKEKGKLANQIKQDIGKAVQEKRYKIQDSEYRKQDERIDVTLPGKKLQVGHLHPLTQVKG